MGKDLEHYFDIYLLASSLSIYLLAKIVCKEILEGSVHLNEV
jgi:hypothetical protein